MKRALVWTGLLFVAVGVGTYWFGPREPVELNPTFEPRKFGEGIQVYFESTEAAYDDIVPGVEKRVIWQDGFKEQRTPVSILYLHGFSASSEEIRPVPDLVADALGANLVYTRLQGHGRSGEAMAEGTASGWMQDVAEGLAAARAVGEKVVVISTSTGGTLAAAAAVNPELSQDVAGMVFVSPNFGVNAPGAWIPGLPWARSWLPLLMGQTREVSGPDEEKNTYWSASYPWEAVVPMTVLVDVVYALDFSDAQVPALFWFSDDDQVVRPDLTHKVAQAWGGPAVVELVTMGPEDDPASHVIAGRLMSPGQTDATVSGILAWLKTLGVE
ncbi:MULTISPECIES: alpha/beta fold hydrolase [unclassified Ruegeria]|uniref:alpha/beta hydrolase n=1 Tax=unclassified Ruegeria TaxID=2625375 RepID=UPI001ADB8220|nr:MULTISPECIES: alpha/beta fold hydrolase [unclassified Ruegeria]MBO9410287.1 alpha/beta fold hydrolase [Ruegeria sp. R8_1]MBO9414494.1 alpha/beta fold hydrolase [Ruegeria sp. R8_2]